MPQVFNAEVDALDALEGRDPGATAFLAPPPRRPGLVVGTGAVQADRILMDCVLDMFGLWSRDRDATI